MCRNDPADNQVRLREKLMDRAEIPEQPGPDLKHESQTEA